MKVLIVARYKSKGFAPFITEQADALRRFGSEIIYFPISGRGIKGYFGHLQKLRKLIHDEQPDLIHAHFVFSGLLACMQKSVPVVITYHGSDINESRLFPLSKIAMRLSSLNVFVSRQTFEKAHCRRKAVIIPCGVDINDIQLIDKKTARQRMGLREDVKYVLFAGPFNRPVKNPTLARETVSALKLEHVELLELNGYTREEVTLLLCAVDALLMTSLNEGSPQIIKEALACGCPIVSVDVGDVRERVSGIEGCYVSEHPDHNELSALLNRALKFSGKTLGRQRLIDDGLDNRIIAKKLLCAYSTVL